MENFGASAVVTLLEGFHHLPLAAARDITLACKIWESISCKALSIPCNILITSLLGFVILWTYYISVLESYHISVVYSNTYIYIPVLILFTDRRLAHMSTKAETDKPSHSTVQCTQHWGWGTQIIQSGRRWEIIVQWTVR